MKGCGKKIKPGVMCTLGGELCIACKFLPDEDAPMPIAAVVSDSWNQLCPTCGTTFVATISYPVEVWNTERPKEQGWYWIRFGALTSVVEVMRSTEDNSLHVLKKVVGMEVMPIEDSVFDDAAWCPVRMPPP